MNNYQLNGLPDSLTELEIHLIARKRIAQIKYGHTYAKPSEEWYKEMATKNELQPFEVRKKG